jgi:superfamily II DNA or RNA helicase
MSDTYLDLIARKSASASAAGFIVSDGDMASHLILHQPDLVRWALRRGRAALFADTGLGKTIMLLEWARHVSQRGRVLILAPLAVGPQIEREAARFGVDAVYRRIDDGSRIIISNYEMRHRFDPSQFIGIVIDESSILKSFDGRIRTELIEAFSRTPFRLACTATPAPNDFTELGNHAEFLGIRTRAEMLAEYFVHDGGSTQDWRLKGHAVTPFWRWVATWGAVVKRPSDLGYDDGAFILPPLEMREHVIADDEHDIAATGMLFPMPAVGLTEQRKAKRETMPKRVDYIRGLVDTYGNDQAIVWCELNDEQDAVTKALGDQCVSIDGRTKDDLKIERVERWLSGGVKTLVSKIRIFGFGMNFQNCHHVAFGANNSYESVYQAIRRCWRFGQHHPVTADLVCSEREGNVLANYRKKEADAAKMAEEMTRHVGDAVRAEVRGLTRQFNDYQPQAAMTLPSWL